MADWKDVMQARTDTEDFVLAAQEDKVNDIQRQVYATIAVARAIQEVGMIIDYALRERSQVPRA